ncbi:hypothetical protein LSTR_LSTR007401 [Laodelphax striatellus]|uniref:BRISC and BRCA1-A complex member 2 n=1 Tax=Laodelphax striatellus TaxID=195883 RepID=A0A482XPE2_LAOST|nr:hypothetical protein LSTR_LSTR007401 [Laodelphax striatellus]
MENMIRLDTQQTLQSLTRELLKHNFGIAGEKATISDVRSGLPGVERNESCADFFGDRFQLSVPYAGQRLNWDIVLDPSSPDNPPDFDLNDDAFTNNYITVDCLEQAVPSLFNWQADDRNALKNVVSELLQLYKKYQVEELKELPNYTNYKNAMESGLVTAEDAEVLIESTGYTTFLFRLPLDMSDFEVQDGDYAIHVSLDFSRPTARMSKPKLQMTPALLDVMNTKQFYQKHENTCSESSDLADYLRRVLYKAATSILHHKVKPVTKRKRFVFEFLNFRGTSVLEFDAIEFLHASFLLDDSKGFVCILKLTLADNFPITPPVYALRSVYNADPVDSFRVPFQMCWDNRSAVKKALQFIENEIEQLRNKPQIVI